MPTEKIQKLVHWYEKHLAPVAFLAGFVFDTLTLTRADLLQDNLIMLSHIALSAFAILAFYAYESGKTLGGLLTKVAHLLPVLMQFSFGALFSGFVVLYFRSGTFAADWSFLAVLVFLLVGNEFFRERYRRLAFRLSLYFAALFFYAIFAVPTALGRIGADIFLLSGMVSLAAAAFFVFILTLISRSGFYEHKARIFAGIGGGYFVLNLMYFANVIPPIPLALKRLGVYHSVEKISGGNYKVLFEKAPWYQPWLDAGTVFHWQKGEALFAFSAVFAPAEIDTRISHHWLYFDPVEKRWVEKLVAAFPIIGGRDFGYRGYTLVRSVEPGDWRIDVRTERGQLLGRSTFTVVESDAPPALEVREY